MSEGRRRAAIVAALTGIALLMAACGDGSRPAGPGAATPASLAVQMDNYASCVRAHGVPDFYISRQQGTAPPSPGVYMVFHGWVVPVNPSQPAQKACLHLLPHGTPATGAELHQQFLQALKAARCMRSHGYPTWPDPTEGAGPPVAPAGIDTNSPRFQATAKACGAAS